MRESLTSKAVIEQPNLHELVTREIDVLDSYGLQPEVWFQVAKNSVLVFSTDYFEDVDECISVLQPFLYFAHIQAVHWFHGHYWIVVEQNDNYYEVGKIQPVGLIHEFTYPDPQGFQERFGDWMPLHVLLDEIPNLDYNVYERWVARLPDIRASYPFKYALTKTVLAAWDDLLSLQGSFEQVQSLKTHTRRNGWKLDR